MISAPICLRVKGPFACFTRPEFHVERVSYPIITPSAARGIFDAILMKPIEKPDSAKRHNKIGFRWVITRLGIVQKGTFFSILRNELGYQTHRDPAKATPYDINDCRAQRHSLILKDVEYLIEAVIEVPAETRQRAGRQLRPSAEFLARNKYHQMAIRRAKAGQCFAQPFFGCREFSVAEWELVPNPPERILGQPYSESFGNIFQDFDFSPMWDHWRDGPRPPSGWDKPGHRPEPRILRDAVARHGWIEVIPKEDLS